MPPEIALLLAAVLGLAALLVLWRWRGSTPAPEAEPPGPDDAYPDYQTAYDGARYDA